MAQKLIKIILTVFVILLMVGISIIGIFKYKDKLVPKSQVVSVEDKLVNDCASNNAAITLCHHSSETQTVVPITSIIGLTLDGEKIILPAVNAGDQIAVKFNFNYLIKNTPKQELNSKIPDSFRLCFKLTPSLTSMKVFPQDKILFASNLVCTKELLKRNDDLVFSFVGNVSYPSSSNAGKINTNQVIKYTSVNNDVKSDKTKNGETVNPLFISNNENPEANLETWVVPLSIPLTNEADFYHNYDSSIIRLGDFLIWALSSSKK